MDELIGRLAEGDFQREVLSAALLLEGEGQETLFALARSRRDEHFPDRTVEVRSVVEISNICLQKCSYCKIGANGTRFQYTIGFDTLMSIVESLYSRGRRYLAIQSGENPAQPFIEHVCKFVFEAKSSFPDLCLIVTLGNLSRWQYLQLRGAGADRYILKFETSNEALYKHLKPNDRLQERLRCLRDLVEVGFQVGSGNMVGLPGQVHDDLVRDLELLRSLDLRMASSSAFIPGSGTEFQDQPPGSLETTLNMMALTRIMNPHLMIPSTSSLEKRTPGGQLRGLMAGANVVTIHDGTPDLLKQEYPIYSSERFTPDEEHVRAFVTGAGLKL